MDLKEWSLNEVAARHPWELARLDAVDHLIRKNAAGKALRLLDFGCGDAFVVSSLAHRLGAQEVVAVDSHFTPSVRDKIQTRLPSSVKLCSSMEEAAVATTHPASWVLMLDVLEHCEKDQETLESVVESAAVTSDAHFLITVPAYQTLYSRLDRFLGHYRRYDRNTLLQLVRNSGLEPVESSYFFSSLLAPRGAQVLGERLGLSKSEPKGLGDHQAGWADALIRGVLKVDFRVCEGLARAGIYLPGLSLYVLARRTTLRPGERD